MPLPASRDELLERLRTTAATLDAEFDDLTDPRQPDAEGVSACDRLGYQIGWGRCLLAWEAAEQAGKTPAMPAPGFNWNQLGDLARSFYESHAERSPEQLRAMFAAVVDDIAGMIGTMNDAELFEIGKRAWAGEKWPVVKWIQVNTIAPYKTARTKIRKHRRESAV